MQKPGVVFDLDGTLIDSVYQHVLAWRKALSDIGVDLSAWRIHRRIGMSGGLLAQALIRESGIAFDEGILHKLQQIHAEAYLRDSGEVRVLPGAVDLLNHLTDADVAWGIATSGRRRTAQPALALLGVKPPRVIVTRDDVDRAKPDPDLFIECARQLARAVEDVVIVGDSVWDLLAARRARALGVGLQSGGYGRGELEAAGAYRVYEDPLDFMHHLDEVGIR
jgi:HAD superfamily hydrolase (TIGR01549 family)